MRANTIMPVSWVLAASSTFAASTVQLKPTADAFVSSAAASSNFGAQGTLAIAGDSSTRGATPTGRFESVLKFNLSSAVSQFDGEFGSGNWSISTVTFTLASNVGTQGGLPSSTAFPAINGGLFSILWMQDDSWSETGVTYDNLSSHTGLTSGLGSWSYVAPGNNVGITRDLGSDASFLADLTAGGDVSLLVTPGDDTVAYLFNSRTYNSAANHPLLSITAIPEPVSSIMLVGSSSMFVMRRRRSNA